MNKYSIKFLLFASLILGKFSGFCLAKDAVLVFENKSKQSKLLELYTSQGCSSCPPAERWITAMLYHPDLWTKVFPVAFHVSYWDYLGWKDPFANAKYNSRQEMLAGENTSGSIYTPGFYLNAQEWRGWRKGEELESSKKTSGNLKFKISGNKILVEYHSLGSLAKPKTLRLWVSQLGFGLTNHVDKGENAGKKITQDFVVLSLENFSSNNGVWEFEMPPFQHKGKHAIVVWVSEDLFLTPLQVAGGWLD